MATYILYILSLPRPNPTALWHVIFMLFLLSRFSSSIHYLEVFREMEVSKKKIEVACVMFIIPYCIQPVLNFCVF